MTIDYNNFCYYTPHHILVYLNYMWIDFQSNSSQRGFESYRQRNNTLRERYNTGPMTSILK